MTYFTNKLPNLLQSLAHASSQSDVCEIFASFLMSSTIMGESVVYIDDEDFSLRMLFESSSYDTSSFTEYSPIMYLEEVVGHVKYEVKLDDEHSRELSLLLSIVGMFLFSQRKNDASATMKRSFEKSTLLLDTISEMLSDIILRQHEEDIAKMAGQFLMGHLLTGSYAIIRKDASSTSLLSSNGFNKERLLELINNADEQLPFMEYDDAVRFPLLHGEVNQGFLIIGKRSSNSFNDDDFFFIRMIAMITAIALERVALFEEEAKLRLIHRDLQLAREVQQYLLPSFSKHIHGCEITGMQIPSQQIGGDYMDVLEYENGSLLLIMADVAGKGISAAMIMGMVKSACTLLVKQGKQPRQIVSEINELVFSHTSPEVFVTFACILINAERTAIISINAGHESPILRKKDGSFLDLENGCMVLGVLKELGTIHFTEYAVQKGDMICMFTDGLSDASYPDGNSRIKRQLGAIEEFSPLSAEKIFSAMHDAEVIRGAIIQSDDKTLLLARIT